MAAQSSEAGVPLHYLQGPQGEAGPSTSGRDVESNPVCQSQQDDKSSSERTDGLPSWVNQNDLHRFPIGWPRFAAEQNIIFNGALHRRFGYLLQRLLYDLEVRIANLEDELSGVDAANMVQDLDRNGKEPETSTEQPRDRKVILEEIEALFERYAKLLQHDTTLRLLPRASRREIGSMGANAVQGQHMDADAVSFMRYWDDFVSTQSDRAHYPLNWLIFGGKWRCIREPKRLFTNNKQNQDSGGTHDEYTSSKWLGRATKILIVSCSTLLLLTPVAVLYLVDLTRAASFGVVVAFGFGFVTVVSIATSAKIDNILFGLSAYMAVLVTFLANLVSSSGRV